MKFSTDRAYALGAVCLPTKLVAVGMHRMDNSAIAITHVDRGIIVGGVFGVGHWDIAVVGPYGGKPRYRVRAIKARA
jgi:hypothetical protein